MRAFLQKLAPKSFFAKVGAWERDGFLRRRFVWR
jgi:hypothetical protein